MEMQPCSTSAETEWQRTDQGMEKDHLQSKEIGGYYRPNDSEAFKAMRPSATLNQAIESLNKVLA